ncbi:hypothetical protein [Rhizobium sp. SYY.PMSO]|uniref:hypothetical protein n=1 Tax=Rhizobium sp. SYY.PMSO TaxID=3382192 RepID=UPI0039901AFB
MDDVDDQAVWDFFKSFGARGIRAFVFWLASFILLLCLPYEHSNSFFLSVGLGLLSSVNLGARIAAIAIFIVFVLNVLPPQVFAAFG